MAVNRDNERETDSGLGRGDRDGEQHKQHAGAGDGLRAVAPERDEVQVGGVQHQLDAEQHEDRVAAREGAGEPDAEQQAREDQAELEGTDHEKTERRKG